jgi:hypothetical protein
MAPVSVAQGDAAAERQGMISASRLEDLPVETLLEILSHLDFESFDSTLLVSRRLNSVVEAHWPSLLRDIIEREFSPVQDFFKTLWDVDLPGPLGCSQLLTVCHTTDGFQPLLNLCRVIKRWETEFPSLRFANCPQHSRIMSPDELYRLRRGLYNWWRYARAFHSPDVCVDNTPEVRRSFVRQFSTTELHEVFDMWQTISSAVGREICPSVVLVQGLQVSAIAFLSTPTRRLTISVAQGKWATKEENARIGWGGLTENTDIVRTMMKLQPDDLLHLLVYRHRYATKASVIRFVRLRYPG